MKNVFRRKPSAAMVVAIMALVLVASGTAVAASKLVSGDKLIKKHSLSGNRLRNHTISRTQINLGRLGTVPSANNANHATNADNATNANHATSATSANNATNANHATSATNANNANTVGGQPPSAFAPSSAFVRTGLVKASVGQTIPFSSFGPFTVTLKCTDNGGGSFTVAVTATSSEDNSDIFGAIATPAGTSEPIDSRTSTSFDEADDNLADFIAPSGKAYQMDYTFGVHGLGADCFGIGLTEQS